MSNAINSQDPLDPWFCTAFGTAGPPELSMGPFRVTQPDPWVNPTHGQL